MEASPVRFEFGDGVTVEKFYHHWFTSDRIPEWLAPLCGQRVYECVWEPLVRAKFGKYADEISAVWMWKSWCTAAARAARAGESSSRTSRADSADSRRRWAGASKRRLPAPLALHG